MLRKFKAQWYLWKAKPLGIPPAEVAVLIDSILYSAISETEMLRRLEPIIRLGDTAEVFIKRTGLKRLHYFGHGPGVREYTSGECGLMFTTDPYGFVSVIGRQERIVGNATYPERSLSEPFFSADGYACSYDK